MSDFSTANALIERHARRVPDFPQPGVEFIDLTPVLADSEAFDCVIDALGGEWSDIDLVAGLDARGFLLGGTAGRTTLNGEGLQHEDGHSHIFSATIPNCVSYDPTFAHEVAVIMQRGLKRMVEDQENVFYYITLLNENYAMPALPKGIARKVQGGRTPCLEGPENAQKAAAEDGWTYDSSTVGAVTWPEKANGVWNFPIPSVQVHGSDAMGRRTVLAMDYNWLSAFNTWAPEVSKAERGRVMEKTYEHELEQALEGNRAPLVLGNHLAAWDDGTYLDAMERFTRTQCPREEVHCVSFAELVEFLDAQDPQRLAAWRTVPPGGRGRW